MGAIVLALGGVAAAVAAYLATSAQRPAGETPAEGKKAPTPAPAPRPATEAQGPTVSGVVGTVGTVLGAGVGAVKFVGGLLGGGAAAGAGAGGGGAAAGAATTAATAIVSPGLFLVGVPVVLVVASLLVANAQHAARDFRRRFYVHNGLIIEAERTYATNLAAGAGWVKGAAGAEARASRLREMGRPAAEASKGYEESEVDDPRTYYTVRAGPDTLEARPWRYEWRPVGGATPAQLRELALTARGLVAVQVAIGEAWRKNLWRYLDDRDMATPATPAPEAPESWVFDKLTEWPLLDGTMATKDEVRVAYARAAASDAVPYLRAQTLVEVLSHVKGDTRIFFDAHEYSRRVYRAVAGVAYERGGEWAELGGGLWARGTKLLIPLSPAADARHARWNVGPIPPEVPATQRNWLAVDVVSARQGGPTTMWEG